MNFCGFLIWRKDLNNERQKVQAYQSAQQKTLKKWTLFSGITLTALSFGLILHSGTAQADATTTSSSSVSQATANDANTESVVLTSTSASTNSASGSSSSRATSSSSENDASAAIDTNASSSVSDTPQTSTTSNIVSSTQDSATAQQTTSSQDLSKSSSESTTTVTTDESQGSSLVTDSSESSTVAASSTIVVVANTDQEIALQALAAYSTSADAIDVSSYQGAMSVGTYSWLKSLGVKYVIVKLTQGTTYTNPYAQTQINNAKAAGLTVATYDYAVFTDSASAIAEADHYANVASSYGLDGSTLMIADMEDNVTKRSNIAALLNEFWNELSRRGYTNHGVYASYSYDQTYNVSSTVGHSKTWIAAYYYDHWKNTILNSDYGAWQYTDSFNGYDGSIDMGMFSTYMSLNGEKEENGYWYLYKNGVRQTGFQSLSDGRTVYYNSQGQMQYGEQKINGYWYYFNTSSGAMATGFQKLPDGRTVYYNSQGQMQYGEQRINGYWYYFNTSSGAMVTGFQKLSDGRTVYYNGQGQMQYGSQMINGNKYYFNTWSGAMTLGEITVDGRNYYYDSTTGIQEVGLVYNQVTKKLQYYDPLTGALKTGVTSVNNNNTTVKLNIDGSVNVIGLTTGLNKVGNNTYYYDADKDIFVVGWQVINNQKYYFDVNTAQMTIGEKDIKGYWYYFNNNGAMQSGFVKLANGKTVYYNAQGQMQYGLQTINGKIYYFNPWSGEMYTGREAKINDKWYNFMSDGSASTGFTKLASGKTVYYNAQGQMQHGEKKIDGKWFYFNENTGNVADGFTTLPDGRRVYYDINFQDISKSKGMLYGEQTLKNLKYYFNVQSGVQEKGVVYNIATGRLQYYGAIDGSLSIELQSPINTDEDGNIILNDGENEINDQWYYYDVQNGKMVTGWKKLVDNNHGGYREVYYDLDTAQMAHGEKKINGVWYYFDKQDGNEVVSSFVKLADGRVAYYDEKGHMSYGEKEIGNYWYYFDLSNGNETVSNFIKLNDGRTVYYNAQGHMVYNWQNINGSTYYFNPQNGNMYVGAQWINGQEYYFDYITGAQVKDQWTAKLLEWFFNRIGKLTYSMDGSRNGADGTADCSGSLTQALYEAGAWRYSLLYNTEMLHSYLLGNGYHLAYENNDYTSPVVGDVIIWGQRGHSAGGAGHTGVISGSGQNGTMISTCYWTEGEKGTAVQNFPYFWYWGKDNYPYYYVYRR